MTEENLQDIIDRLNTPQADDSIFTREIGKYVEIGKIWPKEIPLDTADHLAYTCYLIKDEEGKYIGCVLDMNSDLHWYLVPSKRRQGYLTCALRKTILPHLSRSRSTQSISIDKDSIGIKNHQASLNVALAVGFQPEAERSLVLRCNLDLSTYKRKHNAITKKHSGLTEERLLLLRQKVNQIATSMDQIHAEIEMKFGTSKYTKGLKHLVKEIKKYRIKLLDASLDFEEKTYDG